MSDTHDYVHPTAITAWQLIGAVVGVFVIMVIAGWTIVTYEAANNKAISDDLKTNYLTITNHNDLVNRFTDFRNDTNKQLDKMMPRKAFEDFLKERNKLIDGMREDIKGAVTKVEQGLRESASKDAIAGLQSQISQLRELQQQRNSQFSTKEESMAHAASDIERLQSIRREVDALRAELAHRKGTPEPTK